MFRERALLHYQAYCADNRDVILSRRACGVSKNLLRPPRSSCNAIMPVFLYTNPIVTTPDPSIALPAVATLRMTERRVAAAVFHERALLHYQACCAVNRDVILSRRACGVSKNLLRFPQSNCNAIMPMFLYTNPIVTLPDPSIALPAVASLRMTERRVAATLFRERVL